nr:VOC family protein [Mycolicibacterium mengxianglii]
MTLLRELVTAEDFTAAVKKLADPICRRFDLPDADQLGLVVPDAVAADQAMARDWALDPAFIFDSEISQWIENGKELGASARFGFSYHRGYELELIQPRHGADLYARDLNPDGEIFLHHVGVRVRNLDLHTARLTSQGVPLLVRGRSGSGPLSGEFAYLDTRAEFGMITELICTRFLGIHTRIPPPKLARYMGRRQINSDKRVLSL